jgi:hypothetical protein
VRCACWALEAAFPRAFAAFVRAALCCASRSLSSFFNRAICWCLGRREGTTDWNADIDQKRPVNNVGGRRSGEYAKGAAEFSQFTVLSMFRTCPAGPAA